MELNHLRYFYEVAKSGSFSNASRRLRISQSALSKAVLTLEQHEGVKLFERTPTGVSLTAVGAEIYLRCESIFQTLTEIENTVRGKKETCEGILRFGASDHVTNYLLMDVVRTMRELHPKLIPSILSAAPNEIIASILNNEIEFGLFLTQIPLPQLSYEPLAKIEMAVVCRPSLIDDAKGATEKARLKAVIRSKGFIGSIKAQYRNHPSQALMDLLSDDPHISFESNSQESQKRFCVQGGGVAFLARFMVEKEIEDGTLIELKVGSPLASEVWLAKRNGRALSFSARTFIDRLLASGKLGDAS